MRIDSLRIRNYRVLRDVKFDDLKALTVLVGPNGSGKSTVFDAFAFLHEAFTGGLRSAWERRNRMGAIRSRGSEGPVEFELKYKVDVDSRQRQTTYQLAIGEEQGQPVIEREMLRWTTSLGPGRPTHILDFTRGRGRVYNEQSATYEEESLDSPDLAEDIRELSGRSQVLVTTHSREFLAAIEPKELWTISRGDNGYASLSRVSQDERVMAMLKVGASLPELWAEGYLTSADPKL